VVLRGSATVWSETRLAEASDGVRGPGGSRRARLSDLRGTTYWRLRGFQSCLGNAAGWRKRLGWKGMQLGQDPATVRVVVREHRHATVITTFPRGCPSMRCRIASRASLSV
jgi:hypothetical protein